MSIGMHLGLIAIGMLITWTVIIAQDEGAPERIRADFQSLQYQPVIDDDVEVLEWNETTFDLVQHCLAVDCGQFLTVGYSMVDGRGPNQDEDG